MYILHTNDEIAIELRFQNAIITQSKTKAMTYTTTAREPSIYITFNPTITSSSQHQSTMDGAGAP